MVNSLQTMLEVDGPQERLGGTLVLQIMNKHSVLSINDRCPTSLVVNPLQTVYVGTVVVAMGPVELQTLQQRKRYSTNWYEQFERMERFSQAEVVTQTLTSSEWLQ